MRTLGDAIEACKHSYDAQMITDSVAPRIIVYANPAWLELFSWSSEEIHRQTSKLLHGPLTSRAELQSVESALVAKQSARAQLVLYGKRGDTATCNVFVEPLFDDSSTQTISHHL
ncbi:hypothetical protein T492DRAFT_585123, partial [Pavlovales sp. CCMP2436]